MSRDRLPINTMHREAQEYTDSSRHIARELISTAAFVKYKEAAERDVRALRKIIQEYKNPDPVQYAFFIQSKVNQLNEREWLLCRVESDAGVNNETK